jgi:hypothetical protein
MIHLNLKLDTYSNFKKLIPSLIAKIDKEKAPLSYSSIIASSSLANSQSWRFTPPQVDILANYLISVSDTPDAEQISHLYQQIGSVGANQAQISRNMIALWFKDAKSSDLITKLKPLIRPTRQHIEKTTNGFLSSILIRNVFYGNRQSGISRGIPDSTNFSADSVKNPRDSVFYVCDANNTTESSVFSSILTKKSHSTDSVQTHSFTEVDRDESVLSPTLDEETKCLSFTKAMEMILCCSIPDCLGALSDEDALSFRLMLFSSNGFSGFNWVEDTQTQPQTHVNINLLLDEQRYDQTYERYVKLKEMNTSLLKNYKGFLVGEHTKYISYGMTIVIPLLWRLFMKLGVNYHLRVIVRI